MSEKHYIKPDIGIEQWLELTMSYILQFKHKAEIYRMLIQAGCTTKEAYEYFQRAMGILRDSNSAAVEEMRDIYIRSLADLKARCMAAQNLEAEIKVMRDIGVALGILKPNMVKLQEEPIDKTTEARIKDKVREWARKHATDDDDKE